MIKALYKMQTIVPKTLKSLQSKLELYTWTTRVMRVKSSRVNKIICFGYLIQDI